jgi:hypothetical protein
MVCLTNRLFAPQWFSKLIRVKLGNHLPHHMIIFVSGVLAEYSCDADDWKVFY